jgi:hypothetical protein
MAQILSPNELKQISADAERAAIEKEAAQRRRIAEAESEVKLAFQSRQVAPEAMERINAAVRIAAEQGQHEVLVIKFPSSFCNDRGRSINSFEADWPKSLEGFGKTAFEFFQKELEPLGFSIRAEIISFPGGMPGDVGMYIRW